MVPKDEHWKGLRHSLTVFVTKNLSLGKGGQLKTRLLQCYYVVLWIHNIDAICKHAKKYSKLKYFLLLSRLLLTKKNPSNFISLNYFVACKNFCTVDSGNDCQTFWQIPDTLIHSWFLEETSNFTFTPRLWQ